MKYSAIAVTFAAFAAGVVAQSLADIPPCPQKCILGGEAKTSCSIVDIPCSCRDLSYQAQLGACMAKCPPEEAAKGAEVGQQICKAAGVEITIPSSTSAPVAIPSTEAPAETETATTTESATTTAVVTTEAPTSTTRPAEDDAESTTTAVVVPPTTTLITSATGIATGVPVPSGNTTTNGTITPPTATPVPPTQGEDSGAGKVAFGSLLGVAVMGAVAFAL